MMLMYDIIHVRVFVIAYQVFIHVGKFNGYAMSINDHRIA